MRKGRKKPFQWQTELPFFSPYFYLREWRKTSAQRFVLCSFSTLASSARGADMLGENYSIIHVVCLFFCVCVCVRARLPRRKNRQRLMWSASLLTEIDVTSLHEFEEKWRSSVAMVMKPQRSQRMYLRLPSDHLLSPLPGTDDIFCSSLSYFVVRKVTCVLSLSLAQESVICPLIFFFKFDVGFYHREDKLKSVFIFGHVGTNELLLSFRLIDWSTDRLIECRSGRHNGNN